MTLLRRVTRMAYGDALHAEVRVEGDVPVFSSGGLTGSHNTANTRGPCIVVGRKGSFGSVHWSPQPAFVIDTAFYIDETLTDANLRWLYFALQALDLKNASQDVGVPGLSREAAYSCRLPRVPSASEQISITSELDKHARLVDIQARRVAAIQERAQAARDEAVLGLLAHCEMRIPTWSAPDYGKSVPVRAVLRSRDEFAGEAVLPLLTVTSASGVAVRTGDGGRAPSEDLSAYRIVQPGDFVVNKLWARFGAYGVADTVGLISPAYWSLVVDQDLFDPLFLHHLLRSGPYMAEIGRLSKDMPPNGFDLGWATFRDLRLPRITKRVQVDFVQERLKQERMLALARMRLALLGERLSRHIHDHVFGELAQSA